MYWLLIRSEGDNNQFKWVKTNDPSKKISLHYTIGRKEGGLAHLEVDLANWSLAGEPFDRISVALILSIDLDVKDLMDFGDWPSSVREWVITNKIWENKFKHNCQWKISNLFRTEMKLISPFALLNVHFIYIIKQLLSESVSEFTISSSIFRLCLWRELFQKCRFLILKLNLC